MVVQTGKNDLEITTEKTEPLIVDDVESQKGESEEKKPETYGLWMRIYSLLLLAIIGTYLAIVPIGFANGGCSPENIQIVALVLNFISVFVTFAALAKGYRLKGAGFIFIVLSSIVGIISYVVHLPLPDGICNVYMWNVILIDSALMITMTIVGIVIGCYCY